MITTPTVKTCSKCHIVKSVEDFYMNGSQGRKSECKECTKRRSRSERSRKTTRAYRKKNRFCIALKASASDSIKCGYSPCTATEVEVREAFTGKCYACSVPETECNRKLNLDHDHMTGAFRGWLCSNCNMALGLLADSSERITALQTYLKGEEKCHLM